MKCFRYFVTLFALCTAFAFRIPFSYFVKSTKQANVFTPYLPLTSDTALLGVKSSLVPVEQTVGASNALRQVQSGFHFLFKAVKFTLKNMGLFILHGTEGMESWKSDAKVPIAPVAPVIPLQRVTKPIYNPNINTKVNTKKTDEEKRNRIRKIIDMMDAMQANAKESLPSAYQEALKKPAPAPKPVEVPAVAPIVITPVEAAPLVEKKEKKKSLTIKKDEIVEVEESKAGKKRHGPMKFETLFKTLEVYKSIEGDLNKMPQKYIVGEGDPWPEEAAGAKLGDIMENIRMGITHMNHRTPLELLGIKFGSELPEDYVPTYEFAEVYAALENYKNIYGNFNIRSNYVIGRKNADFPVYLRGIPLGPTLQDILHNRAYYQHRKELIELGIEYPTLKTTDNTDENKADFSLALKALKAYKDLNGNMKVPRSFVVPDHHHYPKDTHGLALGSIVGGLTQKKLDEGMRRKLEALGFEL